MLGVDQPAWLLLLPLAVLPLAARSSSTLTYSALDLWPTDWVSDALNVLLRLCAALTIGALILGLSGVFRVPQSVERIGQGAQIVLLLDRSSSMDRPFAGHRHVHHSSRQVESKGQTARRLLSEFITRRNQDLFGMLVFSTNPIQASPLTDKHSMIQASIDAGNIGRGLAKTDLGQGLIAALEFFADKTYAGSRIVMLVSDGGARLNIPTQERIKNLMQRHRVALYWIYIRTQHTPGLHADLDQDTAQELAPEQLLHQFFQSLEMPYRAYSAENPEALQQAIADVNRLQTLPIRYQEVIPKRDLSNVCYALALVLLVLLSLARILELSAWR